MAFYIRFDESFCIECDTAGEALELADLCLTRNAIEPEVSEDESAEEDEPDEPTELEPPPTERQPMQRYGRYEDSRIRAIDWLQANGPAIRSEVCRRCDIKTGSMTPVFNDARFIITEDNLLWLAGVPLPSTPDTDQEEDSVDEPEAEPERPQKVERKFIPRDPPAITPAAIARVVDVVAAELSVSGPLSLFNLSKRTKLDSELLAEALSSERFTSTPQGYDLAE